MNRTTTPLKRLAESIHTEECLCHPTLKPSYIPMRKYRECSANELTRSIIALIIYIGGHAERINTTGRVVQRKGAKRLVNGKWVDSVRNEYIPTSGQRGSADISATINGKSYKIEVKYGRDVQSDAQKVYQNQIEQCGGVYIIAKTFEQFCRDLAPHLVGGSAELLNWIVNGE